LEPSWGLFLEPKSEKKQEKKNSFFLHEYHRAFVRIARRLDKKSFIDAESFAARDKICRIFAAECFELSQKFARQGEEKLSLQYMKLAAKLLGLSLRPKKLSDIEEIKKALAKLKEQEPE
jgi:hypothetical protein